MNSKRIRLLDSSEQDQILLIAVDSGLFHPDEVHALREMLGEYFAAKPAGHRWFVLEDQKKILGATYVAPELFADQVWNLYFIAVLSKHKGQGVGSRLLEHVEHVLRDEGEKTLIIETSSTGTFDKTRAFYTKHGYDEEARIRNWYGPDDAKVIFWKSLQA